MFASSKQYAYCKDVQRVYLGKAPALSVVSNAYGENVTKTWLSCQLIDLLEFSGCKDKLTTFQIGSICEVIMSTWYYLTVVELMHFFTQFKSGKYGKFYGAVDGLAITESLRAFVEERWNIKDRYEREQARQEQNLQDAIAEKAHRTMTAEVQSVGMSLSEFYALQNEYHLEFDELIELAWLFKLGYERNKRNKLKSN